MKFSQFGTFTVSLLFPITAALIIMLINVGLSDLMPAAILGSVIIFLIFCLLFFYQITIYIDNEYVSFKMGIGIFGKKYKIDSLKGCKAVRNPIWYGAGIKILPNGILYNVSGLSAIELSFKNKKGIVRIGTDKPNEIAEIINKKLVNAHVESFVTENTSSIRITLFWTLTALIILSPIAFIFYGIQEPNIALSGKTVSISGIYGQKISVDSISEIDTITNIPAVELRTNGLEFGKTYKGYFKLKGVGKAKLFVYCGYSPYIQIITLGGQSIYINTKNRQKTIELFRKMGEFKK